MAPLKLMLPSTLPLTKSDQGTSADEVDQA
jgi:hypothetical protein